MTTLLTTPRVLSIEPDDPRLSQSRFFYLWNLDPAFGTCLCLRGSWHAAGAHGESFAGPGRCGNPGKHPWHISREGAVRGFRHGVRDALPYAQLLEQHGAPGAQRRLAASLSGVMMIDIDSERALQSFYRISAHVPKDDRLLGVAKTPRGWHVLLACDPAWTQRAVTQQMRSWISDYQPVDASKLSLQGYLLDIRTGDGRYNVWPSGGQHSGRRWASGAEFRAALAFAGLGMPTWWMQQDGTQAPWNLEMTPDLRDQISRSGADTSARSGTALTFDGSEEDRVLAWVELNRWSKLIGNMTPDSGRNNTLNQTAYFAGADAVAAGHAAATVRAHLLEAARRSHTPGANATIASGLTSGLRDRHGRS